MSLFQILLLVSVAIMMSIGQVLLKITAGRIQAQSVWSLRFLLDWYFILALVIYGAAAVFWIFALRNTELSRAHPFIIITFVFTPLLAWWFLGEQLSATYGIGLCLVCAGLAIIARA